jgi:hypothetical protein
MAANELNEPDSEDQTLDSRERKQQERADGLRNSRFQMANSRQQTVEGGEEMPDHGCQRIAPNHGNQSVLPIWAFYPSLASLASIACLASESGDYVIFFCVDIIFASKRCSQQQVTLSRCELSKR